MTTALLDLPVDQIVPSDDNLRERIRHLDDLTASIAAVGVLEPLLVAPGDDGYVLVAGHRRYVAACQAGLATVPAVVREPDANWDSYADQTLVMLAENLQRDDLSPLEEGRGYRRLLDSGWKQKEIAKTVGRSPGHVSQRLTLLHLPDAALKQIDDLSGESALTLAKLARDHGGDAAVEAVNDPQFGHSPDFVVRRVAGRLEAAKAVEAKAAELAADGVVTIPVDSFGDWSDEGRRSLTHLGVDVDEHAALGCHAVVIAPAPPFGEDDSVQTIPVCVSPKLHAPADDDADGDGDGQLVAPTLSDEQARKEREAAERKARKEAAEVRQVTAAEVAGGKVKRAVQDSLVATLAVQGMNHVEAAKVGGMLGLEPVSKPDLVDPDKTFDDWLDAVMLYAAESTTNLNRVAFATALVKGEAEVAARRAGPLGDVYLATLEAYGWAAEDDPDVAAIVELRKRTGEVT